MSIQRMKNNVPQPYVSESRDFQLFLRVLDFVQNSVKFDIDSIVDILDTQLIPSVYVDNLKSKLGFFTSNIYDDRTMRIALSAFPHIMKYKGSEEGIVRCVNTFLVIAGLQSGGKVEVYNKSDTYEYTIRVGISKKVVNHQILKDMLYYVIPTGYLLEIYTYYPAPLPSTHGELYSRFEQLPAVDASEFSQVRSTPITESQLKDDTYNTLYLSVVDDALPNVDTEDENNA